MKILQYSAMFENQTVIECSTVLDKNAYNRAFYKINQVAQYEGPVKEIHFKEVDANG